MIKFNYNIPGKVYNIIFSEDRQSIHIRTFNESIKNELTNFHYADTRNCYKLFKWILELKQKKGYRIEYYEYSEEDIQEILKELEDILYSHTHATKSKGE